VTAERDLRKSTQHSYNRADPIWDPADHWHLRVLDEIRVAVARFSQEYVVLPGTVLDIGSGGSPQTIPHHTYVQVDLAVTRLIGQPTAVCADAHALPFADNIADCIVCVGPVINYCSLIEVISELSRVCKPGGRLLLHVELSNSLEYLLTRHFRSDATIVQTQFRGSDSQWMYSRRNLLQTLSNADLSVLDARYFLVLAALANRVGIARNVASRLGRWDGPLNYLRGIGEVADSAILICEKSP
jgi:SAM-dependent methyltransferase